MKKKPPNKYIASFEVTQYHEEEFEAKNERAAHKLAEAFIEDYFPDALDVQISISEKDDEEE